MSRTSSISVGLPVRAGPAGWAATAVAIVEATKPRITRLVTITALVGFAMAALTRPWTVGELLLAVIATIAGTALAAAGANALNQWVERDRDARMPRTADRPLPRQALRPRTVLLAGTILSISGVALLALLLPTLIPAGVALACVLVYVLAYTPLKPVTASSTLIGAIPGALPPLIGWTAASSAAGLTALIEPGGLILFLIMFVWQLPHFWAIAWMYRDDYAAGGYRMLPLRDPTGWRTSTAVLLTSALLLPLTLAPVWAIPDLLGPVYLGVALLTGVGFLALSVRLTITRTTEAARTVFIASIIHLPVLLVAMVGDALVTGIL